MRKQTNSPTWFLLGITVTLAALNLLGLTNIPWWIIASILPGAVLLAVVILLLGEWAVK